MRAWLLTDPLNKIQGDKAEAGSPGKRLPPRGGGGVGSGPGRWSGLTMETETIGCAD